MALLAARASTMSTDPGCQIFWLKAPMTNSVESLITTPKPAQACYSNKAPQKLFFYIPEAEGVHRESLLRTTFRGSFLCTSWNSFNSSQASLHSPQPPKPNATTLPYSDALK